MTIKNVTIVGAGFVGSQIAMDTAAAGYQVTLVDRDQQILNNTQKRIQDVAVQFYLDFIANHQDGENPNSPALNNLKEAERKHNGFSELLKNLHYSPSLSEGVSKADLVIEAVYERLELKQNIFEQIENAAPRSAILATNSSSLKLSDVGKMIKHKDRFGGLHFFNPLERKRLLEVGKVQETSEATMNSLIEYGKAIGKTTVVCKDCHGFICNRLMIPVRSEAMYMVENGIATPEDIDIALKLGYEIPFGTFEHMDIIGLDTVQDVLTGWNTNYAHRLDQNGLAEVFVRPVPNILKEKVAQGKLGKKTGEGFFKWQNGHKDS